MGNGHLASVQTGLIAGVSVAAVLAVASTPNTAADPRTSPAITMAVAPMSARFIAGPAVSSGTRLACDKLAAKPSKSRPTRQVAAPRLRQPACVACAQADGGARARSRRRGYAA